MKIVRNKTLVSEFGLLFLTIIWGSAFVVVKSTTATLPPSFIISIRFLLSTVLMCVIFFKRLKKIRLGELKGGVIIGIFNVLGYEFQTYGIKYTTAGKNAFLTAIYCVLVPFLYWLVKRRKPNVYNVTSAFICIAGVGLLSLNDSLGINPGDLLSLLCGLCFAMQIVAIDIFTENYDPILLDIIQSAVTFAVACPLAVFTEKIPAQIPGSAVVSLLYLSIFSTFLAFLMQMVCQKYVAPSNASLIMSLESVVGTLCGILFLGENLTIRTFIGCALIFSAILISETKLSFLKKRKKAETGLPEKQA